VAQFKRGDFSTSSFFLVGLRTYQQPGTDWLVTEKGFENGKMKEKSADEYWYCDGTWEVGLRWVNWLEISMI
jgi:hypothetical protein